MKPFFGFLLAGRRHAIPMETVQEVLYLPFIQPSEAIPGGMIGYFNLRGHSLPVLDLAFLMGLPARPVCKEDVIIHVKTENGHTWAFLAEEVDELVSFLPDEVEMLAEESNQKRFVISLGRKGEHIYHMVDLSELWELATQAQGSGRFEALIGQLPEDLSRILKERASSAHTLREQVQESATPCATFGLGGQRFAIPLKDLRGFAKCPLLFPVPGAPKAFLGLVPLQGEARLVADLRPLLGLPQTPLEPEAHLIFVDEAHDGLGFYVESLGEVMQIPWSELQVQPAQVNACPVEGEWMMAGQWVSVLNVSHLLACLDAFSKKHEPANPDPNC